MDLTSGFPNFSSVLTVGEAADYLGVSTATLRNWDRNGKLKSRRHPQNGYRIYLHEDLAQVLRSANLWTSDGAQSRRFDWAHVGETEHIVQFYETDSFLTDTIADFVATALVGGGASVIIATSQHRRALPPKLKSRGVDIRAAVDDQRYVVLDAAKTLAKLMAGDMPDAGKFATVIGGLVDQLARGGKRLHAFGEMVALLWADGNRDAAIRLEHLWNELGHTRRFALLCAYPMGGFGEQDDATPFNGVCAHHSRVLPAESYFAAPTDDERLLEVSRLQQKAEALAAEIAHRDGVERELSAREHELSDFFENGTEGLHKVGPDGTILWANRAEYQMLGYTAEEYVGHSITEFHADQPVILEMLEMLRRGETLHNFPARLVCKDGSVKHVLINSNACIEDGEFAYTRCFTRDVTRQWHAEHALEEASRRKDEFLATLAHELRNPLAPIRNSLELLKFADNRPEDLSEGHGIIERQVVQLTRLVDDLLDVSRITRDKIELRRERIDLRQVLQNAIETSRPLVDRAKHELTVSWCEQPLTVDADPARMAQVFSNLLNNAAKYTEPGSGRIWVEVVADGAEAVVSVRDNGLGISCDALAYVFDMFRQVDRSLERAQGGLGIGLTLVRRLVELHGGTVNAQSDGPGKGSTFVVRLPLAGAATASAEPDDGGPENAAKRASAVGVGRRVLVVDDNKDSMATMRMLLRMKGHDVRTAIDGVEAIAAAEEYRPEVILMDMGMPQMNGYEATQRIRQTAWGRDIRIVAMTGWGQAEDLKRSAEAGCTAHLVKPVDFAALERLLENDDAPER